MARRIETEEQYHNSLEWLVKEAERLENEEEIHDPLLLPETKDELLKRYNFVAEGVLEYRRREHSENVNTPMDEQPPIAPAEPSEPEPPKEEHASIWDLMDDDE